MSLSRASAQFRALTKDLGELVEKHERAKGLDSFHRYEDDLPAFAWDPFRVKLWSKQVEVWEALRASPLVSVAGGNGTGKDFLSAVAMLHHAICRKGAGDPDGSHSTASGRGLHGLGNPVVEPCAGSSR